MTRMEPIDPSLLAAVTGGSMQFDPGLGATMSSIERSRRRKPPTDPMPQAVRMIGTATSDLVTSVQQSRQKSSQAMMQMLPQMMQR